jgi:hypothetical protein
MKRFGPLRASGLLIVVALSVAADKRDLGNPANDPDLAADLTAMLGRWERDVIGPNGQRIHIEKEVQENRDTVSEFDAAGNVIYSHTATFQLARSGKARLYNFANFVVTVGANPGPRQGGINSFIYRLDGDAFYEFWGALDGDPAPPHILAWKRQKPVGEKR